MQMTARTGKQDMRVRTRFILDVLMKYGFRFLVEDLKPRRFFCGRWLGFLWRFSG